MKNLHLMPMNSVFDDDFITEINSNFSHSQNVFFHKKQREKLVDVDNSFVVPDAFTPEYINDHAEEYNKIFLHSLFLSPDEILRLTDNAAKKIVWIVWGHDLYTVKKKQKWTASRFVKESIHAVKKIIRGTYIRAYRKKRAVADKVSKFHAIGIGYSYDEKEIRKKYGKSVPVVYGPYFSRTTQEKVDKLREMHLSKQDHTVNILIGHSGFDFLEHEKYLQKLGHYKDKDICVHMVLSYGASEDRIQKLSEMAISIFGEEKCNIITKMMAKNDYYEYLTSIDIAIFPFVHQSALGNTKRLAYMGTKLYFHPDGILSKGFKQDGMKVYDCREIGEVPFEQFIMNDFIPKPSIPLFNTFNYQRNIEAWKQLLGAD